MDETYYINYLQKHNNENLLNVIFDFKPVPVTNKILRISSNTQIKEMIKIFLYEMKIPEENKYDFTFYFNASKLVSNDNLSLYEKGINSNSRILVMKNDELTNNRIEGKKLKVNVEFKNEIILQISIGTLNNIKDLFNSIEIDLSGRNIFIKEIKINKNKYKRKDERTFSSIGIRENFTCKIVALDINKQKKCIIF